MAFNNRNNLSNESAPWGREVEQKIESNTYDLSQLRLLTENNNKATNGTLGALTRQQQALAELTNSWTIATYSGDFTNVAVSGDYGDKTVVLGSFLVSSPPGDYLTRFCSLRTSARGVISNYEGYFSENIRLDLYLTVQGYSDVESKVRNTASFSTNYSPSTGNVEATIQVHGFDRREATMLGGHSPYNLLVLKADVGRPMTGGTFIITGNYTLTVETSPESSTETITPV